MNKIVFLIECVHKLARALVVLAFVCLLILFVVDLILKAGG
jgi:hypothetical protein